MRVEILVGGIPQPIYRRQSDGTPFVEAQLDRPYVIRVTPLVGGRLEVLSSVDGRNTLKNEAAHPLDNTGMVITGAWDITGFRLSRSETAVFFFSDPEGSVTDRVTGSTKNVGVIGLASYQEFRFNPPPAFLDSMFQGGGEAVDYGLTRHAGNLSKGGESADAGTPTPARHASTPSAQPHSCARPPSLWKCSKSNTAPGIGSSGTASSRPTIPAPGRASAQTTPGTTSSAASSSSPSGQETKGQAQACPFFWGKS
jgi:hypothetical protein